MLVQVNSNSSINNREDLSQRIEDLLESDLQYVTDQITRIEVHLKDNNGAKSGANDKYCMLEARLTGLKPISVTHEAEGLWEAIQGASGKLQRSLRTTLGKLGRHTP